MKYWALLTLAATTGALANQSPNEGVNYTVKVGDTLYGVADRYCNRLADYVALQRALHLKNAQHLQPGTVVALPRDLLKSVPVDAQLAAFRGNVLINRSAPSIGMPVREGAQITTAANSYATLILSNGSKVTLPSQADVKFTRLRKLVIDGSLDYEVAVNNGRLETKATHFTDPNSRFRIKTPLATSAVRGTEFRIAYAKSSGADSLTEVLEGAVAVGAPNAAQPMLVPSHTGAAVTPSGLTRTEQLLPTAAIANIAAVQKDDLVHFAIAPIAGATAYHIQIAKDAGFVDVFDDVRSPTPDASFANVPNGHQFVRASALAGSGFEGLSETSSFTRTLNSIHAIVEQGGHGGYFFKWAGNGAGAAQYRFQIATEKGAIPLIDEPGLTTQTLELTQLPPGTYYWRVGATLFDQGESSMSWTDFEKLTIAGQN